MTVIHLLLTFSGILAITVAIVAPRLINPYIAYEPINWQQYQFFSQIILVLILTLTAAQSLFFIHVVIGLTSKNNK